jgi:hypothetical protein
MNKRYVCQVEEGENHLTDRLKAIRIAHDLASLPPEYREFAIKLARKEVLDMKSGFFDDV